MSQKGIRTGKQIQGDVFNMLVQADLPISGGVYRMGERPRDSKLEDAVVIFTAGFTGEDVDTGSVTVNIFVPDVNAEDGVLREHSSRTAELEAEAVRWVRSLTVARSNYKFKLMQTITTDNEPEIHQHFVVVKLQYEYFD